MLFNKKKFSFLFLNLLLLQFNLFGTATNLKRFEAVVPKTNTTDNLLDNLHAININFLKMSPKQAEMDGFRQGLITVFNKIKNYFDNNRLDADLNKDILNYLDILIGSIENQIKKNTKFADPAFINALNDFKKKLAEFRFGLVPAARTLTAATKGLPPAALEELKKLKQVKEDLRLLRNKFKDKLKLENRLKQYETKLDKFGQDNKWLKEDLKKGQKAKQEAEDNLRVAKGNFTKDIAAKKEKEKDLESKLIDQEKKFKEAQEVLKAQNKIEIEKLKDEMKNKFKTQQQDDLTKSYANFEEQQKTKAEEIQKKIEEFNNKLQPLEKVKIPKEAKDVRLKNLSDLENINEKINLMIPLQQKEADLIDQTVIPLVTKLVYGTITETEKKRINEKIDDLTNKKTDFLEEKNKLADLSNDMMLQLIVGREKRKKEYKKLKAEMEENRALLSEELNKSAIDLTKSKVEGQKLNFYKQRKEILEKENQTIKDQLTSHKNKLDEFEKKLVNYDELQKYYEETQKNQEELAERIVGLNAEIKTLKQTNEKFLEDRFVIKNQLLTTGKTLGEKLEQKNKELEKQKIEFKKVKEDLKLAEEKLSTSEEEAQKTISDIKKQFIKSAEKSKKELEKNKIIIHNDRRELVELSKKNEEFEKELKLKKKMYKQVLERYQKVR
ncbi:hypothetical protein ACFLYH_00645 [Candidatus Dependentiae bacterium]